MTKLYAFSAAVLLSTLILATSGCGQKTESPGVNAPPAPTYRGPDFLRGTIGSLARLRGYEPTLVSGYGLVVGLDGTGSSDAPTPALREWMISELGKIGFGRHEFGLQDVSPAEVFASDTTALVLVEGIIPAGATAGTRFDVMVSTLPGTQATSVRGGTLYPAYLTVGGRNFQPTTVNAMAQAEGPVFSSPFASAGDVELDSDVESEDDPRLGRILAGGVTTSEPNLALVLNRPSYLRVRNIADRINAAYPPEPQDRREIANPQNDTVIDIHIPERFKERPEDLLRLVLHTHMDSRQSTAEERVSQLVELIQDDDNAEHMESVIWSLKSMGTSMVPRFQDLYEHPHERVRMAALRAGTYLRDTRAAHPLMEMVREPESEEQAELAARLLGRILRHHPQHARVGQFLHDQLNHESLMVRVQAYDALKRVGHRSIQRFGFPPQKMELAHALSDEPMVYVTQRGVPRAIVFGTRVRLEEPVFFSAWDRRFMLRSESEDKLGVFYQPRGRRMEGLPTPAIRTTIDNSLVHLIGVMAYAPEEPGDDIGLDMSYSQIVYVLNKLHEEGLLDVPLVLQETDFTRRVIERRSSEGEQEVRPDTSSGPASEENLEPAIIGGPDAEWDYEGEDVPDRFRE